MEQYNIQMANNQQMQEPLEGIKRAVGGEREDELFYDYLISQAPTDEEKEIISSIRDDERRHNRLFRRMYKDFTGRDVPEGGEEEFQTPESYLDGLKRALFGELGAVERYRAIRRRLPVGIYRDMLFDIITDELKHASKYNYLFTLNSAMMNTSMGGTQSGSEMGGMQGGTTMGGMQGGSTMSGMQSGSTMGGSQSGSTMGGSQSGSTMGGMQGGSTMSGMQGGSTMGGSQSGSTMGGSQSGSTMGGSQGGSTMSGMQGGSTMGGSQSGSAFGGLKKGGTSSTSQGRYSINDFSWNRNIMREDTTKFTPDDWVKYITPLVNRAMTEAKEGGNPEYIYQKAIITGVLVGLGKNPEEAISQVDEWERTGVSKQLSMSKMSRYFDF